MKNNLTPTMNIETENIYTQKPNHYTQILKRFSVYIPMYVLRNT